MPFTLQLTLALVVFDTVATKVCEFPSRTDPLAGVTVTTMDGGGGSGGGGVPETVAPPPQPCSPAPAVRIARKCRAARVVHAQFSRPSARIIFAALCVRGRMHGGMQAKGQRKEETSFSRKDEDISTDCLS